MLAETLMQGDTIGLESLHEGATFECTAISSSESTILTKIPKDTILKLIKNNAYVSSALERRARGVSAMHDLETKDLQLRRTLSQQAFVVESDDVKQDDGDC